MKTSRILDAVTGLAIGTVVGAVAAIATPGGGALEIAIGMIGAALFGAFIGYFASSHR